MSGMRPPTTVSYAPSSSQEATDFYNSSYNSNSSNHYFDDEDEDINNINSDTHSTVSGMSNLTSISRNHLSKYQRKKLLQTARGKPSSPTRSSYSSSSVRSRGSAATATSASSSQFSTNTINRTHSSRNSGNVNESFCSEFGRVFDEGNLPICIDQGVVGASKRHIGWKCDLLALDYGFHLPLFLQGLVETDPPYSFLAFEGCVDMILVGGSTNRLLVVLDKLVVALKMSLQSGHRNSVSKGVYVMLLMLKCDEKVGYGAMGKAFGPYLSRILPTLNLYVGDKHRIGGAGAYQVAERSLGDLVTEVLECCETKVGAGAYKVIKCCIPTYQSVALNLINKNRE